MTQSIDVPCKKCSKPLKLQTGDLLNGKRITCRACGQVNVLQFEGGRDFKKVVGDVKKQLGDAVAKLNRDLKRR